MRSIRTPSIPSHPVIWTSSSGHGTLFARITVLVAVNGDKQPVGTPSERPSAPPGASRHWLAWRRRHQALSAWYHHRTRLARNEQILLVS